MKKRYIAIIDAKRIFEHKGVEGYRVLMVAEHERESLKIMHEMMNPKNGHLFERPKIHRATTSRRIMEAMMFLHEVIAIPTSTNPDNPKYEFVII